MGLNHGSWAIDNINANKSQITMSVQRNKKANIKVSFAPTTKNGCQWLSEKQSVHERLPGIATGAVSNTKSIPIVSELKMVGEEDLSG